MTAFSGTMAILIAYGIAAWMGYSVGVQHGYDKARNKRVERR